MEITHIISSEGERLEMAKSLRIRGATEQWLLALENAMYETVKKHLKVTFFSSNNIFTNLNYSQLRMESPIIHFHLTKNGF